MNNNFRFKNGNYFIEDTMSDKAFVHIVIGKNPYQISETRMVVVGKKEGVPPDDFMPIAEGDVLKLQREMNMRKRQAFLGW